MIIPRLVSRCQYPRYPLAPCDPPASALDQPDPDHAAERADRASGWPRAAARAPRGACSHQISAQSAEEAEAVGEPEGEVWPS